MSIYATVAELTARLSSAYAVPSNAAQLLEKASELIDYATSGRSAVAWEVELGDSVTGVAATDLLSSVTDHDLAAGDTLRFTALTGGTGLTAEIVYYVIASGLTDRAFRVSATRAGATVNFTTDITAATMVASPLALIQATCDQVEYWLEVGEEHDVVGLYGSLQGGRVQVSKLPGYLGQRALRSLLRGGLYWAGVNSQ